MKDKKMNIDNTGVEIDINPIPKSKKNKKSKPLAIFSIILIIVIAIAFVIKLDVGKVGSQYATPILKNIPVVKYILPKTTETSLYASYTKEQLISLVNDGESQQEALSKNIEDQTTLINDLEKKIQALQVFEKEHEKFKLEKKEFDEEAANMNEAAFIKFYETIYPENAQEIYTKIVEKSQMDKEQKQYATRIAQMDASRAAKALENLYPTDIDIIISILSNMDMESSAEILGQMDAKIAATIIKQLSP